MPAFANAQLPQGGAGHAEGSPDEEPGIPSSAAHKVVWLEARCFESYDRVYGVHSCLRRQPKTSCGATLSISTFCFMAGF